MTPRPLRRLGDALASDAFAIALCILATASLVTVAVLALRGDL